MVNNNDSTLQRNKQKRTGIFPLPRASPQLPGKCQQCTLQEWLQPPRITNLFYLSLPQKSLFKKILASATHCIINKLCFWRLLFFSQADTPTAPPLPWEPRQRASPAETKEPQPKVLMLDVLVSSGGLTPENTRLLLALRSSNRMGGGPKQRAISSVKTITT